MIPIKWWLSIMIRNKRSFSSNAIIITKNHVVCTANVYPSEPQLSNLEEKEVAYAICSCTLYVVNLFLAFRKATPYTL